MLMSHGLLRGIRGLERSCCRLSRHAALVTLLTGICTPVLAEPFQLVSALDPSHQPAASGGAESRVPVISPDGRYVVFASKAINLVLTRNAAPIPARFLRHSTFFYATGLIKRRLW